ncbi:MAG: hypothetical protein CO079_03835, partial [Nitrosopumilales archaeon CG_4_9_14_0_8_um_filter_34_10]
FSFVLAIFLVGTSMTDITHAQELPPTDFDNGTDDVLDLFKSNVHLWAPSKMIKGEIYEGLAVLPDASATGDLVLVTTSDRTILEISKSITILPESNHGIFEIKALKDGDARIFVSVNGEVTSIDVRVYSSA